MSILFDKSFFLFAKFSTKLECKESVISAFNIPITRTLARNKL